MSTPQTSNERATQIPTAAKVDLKLEVVVFSSTRNHGGMDMNRLLVTLIAGAFTSVVVAQSATGPTGENSGNTQATAAEQAKNVKASKEVTKLSKEEKAKLAKDATKLNVNPENSSGTAATAPGSAHGTDVDDQGVGTVGAQRLYQLIRQSAPIADRTFEIEFLDAGVEAYAFTFG